MTHGEELSSEMQQDSIVLTYLEGLLMHQAAGGSGTTVEKLSGRAKKDEDFKVSGSLFSNSQSNAPINSNHQGSGMLHLKKARLLQSSEDWNTAKRRRLSDTIVGLNGKNEALLTGMVENVPKGKQDSTLLASLLQSFSSRLQSVALSQQIKQSLKDQGFSLDQEGIQEEKDTQCYGIASNHLKTLLNKNRAKDTITNNNLGNLAKNSVQEKFGDSSHSGQSSTKGVVEPISCAARLQAVASMVEKRSSPTASPKPSVACSQLALLLSSEAHLQQYSRDHALKAQNASQLASERLAAMARLKESSEQDLNRLHMSNSPVNHNNPVRTLSNPISNVTNLPQFSNQQGVLNHPLKSVGYKNHADRNHMKPSPNNSLLLHLLKSQNATSISKNNLQCEKYSMFDESVTPTTTDDLSDNNPSFTEDESSDDESTHSNCAPIDLSFKNRTEKTQPLNTASLDHLTETLLHNWDPKVDGLELRKDCSPDSTLKPHQKVTLLQLLLGHKVDENHETMVDIKGQHKAADLTKFSSSTQGHITENSTIHSSSPLHSINVHSSAKAGSPVNLTHQPFPNKQNFPNYISNIQPERHVNPASKHLVELTRNKALQTPVPLANDNAADNAAFSASKLLQNLAQCGKQNPSSDDLRLQKSLGVSNGKTLGLIDRLNSPLLTNQTRTVEESRAFSNPPTPVDSGFASSEIENLLERRTVLQLLLGAPNKSKIEKVQKSAVKEEIPQDKSEIISREQVVAVKIKTEPEDDSNAQYLRDLGVPSPLGMSPHKISQSVLGDSRSPHNSPRNFSPSRNGLLSRLLRQNHDGYDDVDLDINNRNGDSKQRDTKSPCVVPKKRKLHQNEPSESKLKMSKISSPESGNKQFGPTRSLCGPIILQDEINGSKDDFEPKCILGQSSYNESKNISWPRESKGFNVLKQLLLSENCVRDLSQHRNSTLVEEIMKGNRGNVACNSDFAVPSLNTLIGKPVHQTNISQMPFHYSSSVNLRHAPSPEVLGSKVSRTDSALFNVSPTPPDNGPIKWVITDMEKNDFGKDSPRLTKTNPILYYMLQKGGHSAISQELRDRTSWTESFLGNATEVTLKRDSISSGGTNTNGIGFLRSSNHVGNRTFNNSNGNKCGILDMLSIKKEPEYK
ncbi:nuclear receptor-interacting protein 1 [Bombina bombina]|uniref:nuclear receptor-interacting protein 1 n=1 Tax=Bombina bombina TaxID=8345 RepID=UPI00235A8505|nr:nuclear receptor-interacting protein 1 [Bombina bombina]XP_053561991.1 nuclear receptor-interacting protein 1 [Bombina bombina]XP_053561992.1 nuclear receptor-interacting protein 1 [Bombina bombina]